MKKTLLLLFACFATNLACGQNMPNPESTDQVVPITYNGLDTENLMANIPLLFTLPTLHYTMARFKPLPDEMKRQKTYPVAWENTTQPHILWLFRDESIQYTIAKTSANNAITWQVPKKIAGQKLPPGSGYHLMLYNPTTQLNAMSEGFSIKRKIPLGIQIPIVIGIAGGIGYAIYKLLDASPCHDCLPEPDDLNPYTR